MRLLETRSLFAALLLVGLWPHTSEAQPVPPPGTPGWPGVALTGQQPFIFQYPDEGRAAMLLPDVAYDTSDAHWGLSSTPASIAANAPDHKGSVQNINTIVSTTANNATVGLGCYFGQVSLPSSSSTITIWNGNDNIFPAVPTSNGAGPPAVIGQPYRWFVPSGPGAGTYTGTITARVSAVSVTLSSVPPSGVASSITGQKFCFGPPTTTTLAPTETIILLGAGSGQNVDAITTIASIADPYEVIVNTAPTGTLQATPETVMVAYDDSVPLNALIAAAETRGAIQGQLPGDPYIQVSGNYYAPSISPKIMNHVRIGQGSIVQNPPFNSAQATPLLDITVARQRLPPHLNFANDLPPRGLPGLSYNRPIAATIIGDSLWEECCNNLLDVTTTLGKLFDYAILRQRGTTYADTSVSRAIGANSVASACAQVPLATTTPPWMSPPLTPTTVGSTAIGNQIVLSSVSGITDGMAIGPYVTGAAYFNPNSTTWITNISGNTITLSQNTNAIIPTGTQLQITKAWIGDDVHPGYIHDLAPDEIAVTGAGNDGLAFTPEQWKCVINNLTVNWAQPPQIYVVPDYIWNEGQWSSTGWSPVDENDWYGGYLEGWARLNNYPVIELSGFDQTLLLGYNSEHMPMKQQIQFPPTYLGEYTLDLPWTGQVWVRDWGMLGHFSINSGGVPALFAALGGEIQFGIGSNHKDNDNIFRLGLDGSGNLYYEIDSDANTVEVPHTLTGLNYSTDTSTAFWINFLFHGSRAYVAVEALTSAGSPGSQALTVIYDGWAPRFRTRFKPTITSTSGTANFGVQPVGIGAPGEGGTGGNNETTFVADAPPNDIAALPVFADWQLAGLQGIQLGYTNPNGYFPIGPYGSGGVHHASTLHAEVLRQKIEAQNFVGAPQAGTRPVTTTTTLHTIDHFIPATFSGATTITLPAQPELGLPGYHFVDQGGNWASDPLTIAGGNATINNASTYGGGGLPTNSNYGSITIVCTTLTSCSAE